MAARLAAYFQEDFHYAPVGYGTKQRKAAYVVYDQPNYNLLRNNYVNGGPRIRALASSEPSLIPTYNYSPQIANMTLKSKPQPFNNRIAEQSRMAVQRLQRMYEPPMCLDPYAAPRYDVDAFDCESVYSYGGKSAYDESNMKRRSKDKVCKRLSYESCDSYHPSPDLYILRNPDRYQTSYPVQVQQMEPVHAEPYLIEDGRSNNCTECILPPAPFRCEPSQEQLHHWPWNVVDPRTNPSLLSPPSPLDSGLSSQSITSSPSLEAEPIPIHPGQMPIARCGSHICSCPRAYTEPIHVISSPGRYDSGRSSPGVYSVASKSKKSSRSKNRKNVNNDIVYIEDDYEDEYTRSQIRYGMLGLLGEPVAHSPTPTEIPNGKHHYPEYERNNHNNSPVNNYVDQNEKSVKKNGSRSSKNNKSQKNYNGPSVVITEASENSSSPSANSSLSPEPENSRKFAEPETSMGTEASISSSKSSSFNSSRNDLVNEEHRKSKKKALKEINELEDMYKKCALSDFDLLERAERRDLPTVHQAKLAHKIGTLTRSKSDTFYEMLGPTYLGPYDNGQRAPPLRRAGIPDIIGDDMALRKHYKPVTTAAFNPAENTVTYMLCSSHFTPTVPMGKDILYMDDPDIEYDDLSYRKHYFGKKSKVPDPQPPFGIPLRPPPPRSVYNDYLHAVPNGGPKPLCHPRKNPDVVRDDMAFRTLRKDEPEILYYDHSDVYNKKRG